MKGQRAAFSTFYFLIFFAWGAYYPLISQYYKRIGLTGQQIGMALAMGTLVQLIAQPIWGFLSDKKSTHKLNLIIMTTGLIVVTAVMPFSKNFVFVLITVIMLNIFQSGTTPVVDSVVTGGGHDYGKIRLWGSAGFAIAALISGVLTDVIGIYVIFAIYSVSCIGVLVSLKYIDMPKIPKNKGSNNIELGWIIKNKEFMLVIICAFFLYGTLNTQNTYFGLLYEKIGGTMSGVGIAMLLFAMSEVPLMQIAGRLIRKYGAWNLIIISCVITTARWFWYGSLNTWQPVLATFFIHGIIIALFIPSAIYLIVENTPKDKKAVGMTLYYSLGSGMGTAVCQFFSGNIYDIGGVKSVYTFLGIFAVIALCISLTVKFRRSYVNEN